MEATILGHKVTLYGNFRHGLIFRVYDKRVYVHFVINLLKNRGSHKIIWWNKTKYLSGEYKPFKPHKARGG